MDRPQIAGFAAVLVVCSTAWMNGTRPSSAALVTSAMTSGLSVWQPWNRDASNGGVFNLEPAAVAPASGRVDVFVHGLDNGLWHETVST